MGIKRSQLAAILRTVRVDYFGDIITVTYRPDTMTPEKEAALDRARREAQDSEDIDAGEQRLKGFAEQLASSIASWDMVEDDGAPSPLTAENLMTFPSALLLHIMDAMGADMAPKARTRQR